MIKAVARWGRAGRLRAEAVDENPPCSAHPLSSREQTSKPTTLRQGSSSEVEGASGRILDTGSTKAKKQTVESVPAVFCKDRRRANEHVIEKEPIRRNVSWNSDENVAGRMQRLPWEPNQDEG